MEVARYTIGTQIVFPQSEIARFDSQLKSLENKMRQSGQRMGRMISLNLARFSVNQTAMNRTLGNALDIASATTVFRIEHFAVDQAALMRALAAAQARAQAAMPPVTTRMNGRAGGGGRGAAGVGIYGGLSRFYGPAVALGLGGYGLGALNKRNQDVVAAQLQTQAVSTANGGTVEQGDQSFAWLKQQANRVGFNYLQASPDFNTLTANLMGAGNSLDDSKKVFKGFAEFGRINKLSGPRMQLVFKALSDIAGKNALQAQELTTQLGNSLPGAKGIFAQAYQNQLKATGQGKGDLTGSASIVALLDAMKKGQVKGNILTYAADIASAKSQPGLEKASQASQAEQARYQNTISDIAIVASNSGVEEGFARIFRTLSAGLGESNGLVRTLAENFNEATKWSEALALFPQSFIRVLEGKDSLVSDWLGVDKSAQLVKDWQDIKILWDQMSALNPANLFGQFLPTIEATSRELAMILNQLGEFQRWKSSLTASPNQDEQVSFLDRPITSTYQTLGKIFNGTGDALDRAKERGRAVYDDPNGWYYNDPAGYDDQQRMMKEALANDPTATGVTTVTQQFDINIHIDPATLGNIDIQSQAQDLGAWFRSELENASVSFPTKE